MREVNPLYRQLADKFLPKCEDGVMPKKSVWVEDAVSVGLLPEADFKRITTRGSTYEQQGLLKAIEKVFNGWNNFLRTYLYLDAKAQMKNYEQVIEVREYRVTLNNWQGTAVERLRNTYWNKFKVVSRQPGFTEDDNKMWREDGDPIDEASNKITENRKRRLK